MSDLELLIKFFERILPPDGEGMRCVQIKRGAGFLKPLFFETSEEAARFALEKARPELKLDIFHHCSASNGLSREQKNVVWVRSFWLDIDCGLGKDYATQRDAVEAVMLFAQRLKLPRPEIVSSGGGIHVYWPLVEAITPSVWKPVARGLRAKCREMGLHIDFVCSADEARVLRTPFSWNNKPGREPKQVRWLPSPDGPLTHDQARVAFGEVCEAHPHLRLVGPQTYIPRRLGLSSGLKLSTALCAIPVTGLPAELHSDLKEWVERGWGDAYGLWSNVGGAIRNTFGDDGFEVFDLWSQGDPSRYQGGGSTYAKWLKLNHNRIGVGSVYQLAWEIELSRSLTRLIEDHHRGDRQHVRVSR